MTLQLLVAAVGQEADRLPETMGIATDAVIINQTDHVAYREIDRGVRIDWYDSDERGVGRSRNEALMHASADIVLFSDEDIRYEKGYADAVVREFRRHKEADILLFQVDVCEERRTYTNTKYHRVRRWNVGRYPAYAAACRLSKLRHAGVFFSLLFGGGAPFSNGEDSLFYTDCIKKGLRIYATPVRIGREEPRESTWFKGYTEKFFYDRGVLFYHLYGAWAGIWAFRYATVKRKMFRGQMSSAKAYRLMKKGIREGRRLCLG